MAAEEGEVAMEVKEEGMKVEAEVKAEVGTEVDSKVETKEEGKEETKVEMKEETKEVQSSEALLGIVEYLNPSNTGFPGGVIKERFSDFNVTEIDMEGKLVSPCTCTCTCTCTWPGARCTMWAGPPPGTSGWMCPGRRTSNRGPGKPRRNLSPRRKVSRWKPRKWRKKVTK